MHCKHVIHEKGWDGGGSGGEGLPRGKNERIQKKKWGKKQATKLGWQVFSPCAHDQVVQKQKGREQIRQWRLGGINGLRYTRNTEPQLKGDTGVDHSFATGTRGRQKKDGGGKRGSWKRSVPPAKEKGPLTMDNMAARKKERGFRGEEVDRGGPKERYSNR